MEQHSELFDNSYLLELIRILMAVQTYFPSGEVTIVSSKRQVLVFRQWVLDELSNERVRQGVASILEDGKIFEKTVILQNPRIEIDHVFNSLSLERDLEREWGHKTPDMMMRYRKQDTI